MKIVSVAADFRRRARSRHSGTDLFSAALNGLNERNLRSIVRKTDWSEQRRMFQKLAESNRVQPRCIR
jgi:hypothetical protein